MRILYYAPYPAPGDLPIVESLHHAGFTLLYFCTGAGVPHGMEQFATVRHLPVENVQGSSHPLGRLMAKWSRARRDRHKRALLAAALRAEQPACIIAGDLELGAPIAMRVRGKLPLIGISHGSDVMVVPHRSLRLRANMYRVIRGLHGVICFSQSHVQALRAIAEPTCESLVLGAWVDCERFHPLPRPQGDPLVLCLRGSAPVYRPEDLILACVYASRSQPLRLRMLVYPEDEGRLRSLARKQGLEDERCDLVTTRIPHADMPRAYAEATLVAQAIRGESLGYTMLEAMACGRAIVQPRSPVALELLPPEQHPYLCDASPEALAEKMLVLLRHDKEREVLEARNRAHVLANMNKPETMASAVPRIQEWFAQWM